MTQYWGEGRRGGGGGRRHFFLLTLYSFKKIRGAFLPSPAPRSLELPSITCSSKIFGVDGM